MSRPLISVVIPAYNAAPFLGEALESVWAQCYRPLEVIVVDDGSTDATAEVAGAAASEGPMRVLRQAHAGAAAARNAGVREADGPLLAFLDSDDVWLPHKLARQIAELGRDDGPELCFGQLQAFADPRLSAEERRRLLIPTEPISAWSASSLLVARADFHRVGPLDAQWRVGEFIAWFARARECGLHGLVLPEVLVRRRVHGRNATLEGRAGHGDYARIVKAALDRRRSTFGGDGP